MTISNEEEEEISYFTVKIHKTRSSIFSSSGLLRVQKQMDSSAGAGPVPICKFSFRFKKKKC